MAARYSDDEAKEILKRALEGDALATGGFDHEDLVAAAREVGIDPEAVERAASEMSLDREAEGLVLARRRKRRRRWVNGLITYAIVNAFLFGVDYVTPGGPWFYWPLLGWGLFVALSGARAFLPQGEDARREEIAHERARLLRSRAKEAKRRRRDAARAARRGAPSAFDETIERGVTALLDAVATQIERAGKHAEEEIRRASRGGDTGFDAYVADRRGRARRRGAAPVRPDPASAGRSARGAPQTRVAVEREEPEEEEESVARRATRDGGRTK